MPEEIKNGKYKLTMEHRMTQLETQWSTFMGNHFPSVEKKVDRIHWLLITTLIAGILNLLSKFI